MESKNKKEEAVFKYTVSEIKKLYRDGVEAENLVYITFEEIGYWVVTQKGLYNIGDPVWYIMPDYVLPDIPLFESFTRLGKNRRLRAIKFNFSTDIESSDPVYSMGVVLPMDSGLDYETIVIEKYEEGENDGYVRPKNGNGAIQTGLKKGDLPEFLRKSDETNFEKEYKKIVFPKKITGSLKEDGSSITVYYKNAEEFGITSRNDEKKLDNKVVSGYKENLDESIYTLYMKENIKGIYSREKDVFIPTNEIDPTLFEPVYTVCKDSWRDMGMPVLEKLKEYCGHEGIGLAVRAELVGGSLKGSGNKHNPRSKDAPHIRLYGIEKYDDRIGRFVATEPNAFRLEEFSKILGIEYCGVVFCKLFQNVEELRDACESYFKNNLVEGIVVRPYYGTEFSLKYMNLEYDSKK